MNIPQKPTWEDIEKWILELEEKLGDYKPDLVICISRDGWNLGILLSHRNRRKGGWLLHPPLIEIKKISGEWRVSSSSLALRPSVLTGKNVLVVDGILKTGRELIAAKEFLEQNGGSVKTISFFTRDFSEVKPDYVITEGLTYEVIFPWGK